jgi:hypothetical protein
MNTAEILEKIELHLLRVQQMLQHIQNNTFHASNAEKIYNELRQAYELSVVLKHHQPSAPATAGQLNLKEAADPAPFTTPLVQPVAETIIPPNKEPEVITPVKESHSPVVQSQLTPPPVTPQQPTPKLKKEPVIPTMTITEAKVTLNDQKADTVKEVLADKFALSKISDLTKAIPIHEKFLFINELFQGDNVPYNAFIEKVNQPQLLDDALKTVNDYAAEYHWDFESKTFQKMLIYIQRRHA